MLQIAMMPSAIYAYKPTSVSFHFLLKELEFVTHLSFRIGIPDDFTRISGALKGEIGLIQRERVLPYTLELFCGNPNRYELIIDNVSYYDRINRHIVEVERVFFLDVIQRFDAQTRRKENRERCIQALLSNVQLLHGFIDEYFDTREIRVLLFKMQIDFDTFPGGGKPILILDIIEYCQRHSRLDELVELVCQARPHAML